MNILQIGLLSLSANSEPAESRATLSPGSPARIYGGRPTDNCEWPGVVQLAVSGCSGVLVGPDLVLTAAHCVSNEPQETVLFGERTDMPSMYALATCRANPEWNGLVGETDFGYCQLDDAWLPDIVARVLTERDTRRVEPGAAVQVVGFGEDENGVSGLKRVVTTVLRSTGTTWVVGGSGKDGCSGDSGGPAMVDLGSGAQVGGLLSGGGECGSGGRFAPAWKAHRWAVASRAERSSPGSHADHCGLDAGGCQLSPPPAPRSIAFFSAAFAFLLSSRTQSKSEQEER